MTYNTIADMAEDPLLRRRIIACAAEQGAKWPPAWTDQNIWTVAATPGWDDAWGYALNSNPTRTDMGEDAAIITDAMILSSVQPKVMASQVDE